jgi:hypothetical protein
MWFCIPLLWLGALSSQPSTTAAVPVVDPTHAPTDVAAAVGGAAWAGEDARTADAPYGTPDDGRGTPYIVLKTDNICGLDEPRQIGSCARTASIRLRPRASPS